MWCGMKLKTRTLKSVRDQILAVPCPSVLIYGNFLSLNLSILILQITELSYVSFDQS